MRGSAKIITVAGVPIRVHWSFSLLVLFIVAASAGASASAIAGFVGWVVALFASVTIHELAHCFVARRRGLRVKDIVLLPLGGVSEIEGMPSTPGVEFKVAIVGPLTSLLLGGVLALVTVATGASLWPPSLTGGSFLARLAWMNVLLAAFNLIPALPMDGGRVLRALIASRRDPLLATRVASAVAYVLGGAMVLVGAVFDWWLILIGVFVIAGAVAERRNAAVRAALRGLAVGDLMVHEPVGVQASVTTGRLGPWLASFPGRVLPVIDDADGRYLGLVSGRQLVGVHPWTKVGDICDREARVIEVTSPVVPDALDAFNASGRKELAVAWQGHVVGVLYLATLEGVLSQRPRERPGWPNGMPGGRRAA